MRAGLQRLVPPTMLSLFSAAEIERRVCGQSTLDVALLRRHTHFEGGDDAASSEHARMLWAVLESFSPDERAAFLRFTWGRSRLPLTDVRRAGRGGVKKQAGAGRSRQEQARAGKSRQGECAAERITARYVGVGLSPHSPSPLPPVIGERAGTGRRLIYARPKQYGEGRQHESAQAVRL